MQYEAPSLRQYELYETPQLLDVAALAANASEFCVVCLTAGIDVKTEAEAAPEQSPI